MPLPPGTQVGPYELQELLGAGGMGEVYGARDPRLSRVVAVKLLPERFAHSADRLRRFELEARSAGALNHPNILTVFDVGSQEGLPYLVTELLEGETLRSLVRYQRVGVRRSLLLALQVARGLTCAHEAGILHRDLKPENLFLTLDGRVKILDFGLAKLVRPERNVSRDARTATPGTDAGRLVGTAAYMSPEQIRDETVDARCDIFALGAVLYELLSQRAAFTGESESDVMASILRDEPSALAELGAVVPAGVEASVRRCLEKRREDRFGSARELAAALQALLESLGPTPAEGSVDLEAELHPRPRPDSPVAPSQRRIPRPGSAEQLAAGLPQARDSATATVAVPGGDEARSTTAGTPRLMSWSRPLTIKERGGVFWLAPVVGWAAVALAGMLVLLIFRAMEAPLLSPGGAAPPPLSAPLMPSPGPISTPEPLPWDAGPSTAPSVAPAATPPARPSATPPAPTSPAPSRLPEASPLTRAGDLVEAGPGVTPPMLVSVAQPHYPALARRLKRHAQVMIRALVDENGRVVKAVVVEEDPSQLGFAEAALDAAYKTLYKPARKDGVPVKMWIELPVKFQP